MTLNHEEKQIDKLTRSFAFVDFCPLAYNALGVKLPSLYF